MISRTSIETLRGKVEKHVARNSQQRISGMLVRSPKLADGSVEIHTGTAVFSMSSEQIGALQGRFPSECSGAPADLPITEGRIPMSETQFAEYCAVIQRRIEMHRPPIVVR